jgi:signal transduction histidine kinase
MQGAAKELERRLSRDMDFFGIPKIFDIPEMDERIFKFRQELDVVVFDSDLNIIINSTRSDRYSSDYENTLYNISANILNNKMSDFSTMKIDGEEFKVFSKYIIHGNEVLIGNIIQNREFEKVFLRNLFIMLVGMGSVSIVFLMLISRWLAKKSLIPIHESWEQQKKFVADASHELRTPLTVIQTNLEAAMSDKEGTISENEIWLNNAYSETKMMGELINELLTIAKIDSKQIEINKEIFNLSELVISVSEQMEMLFKNNNIEFHKKIEDKIFIKGDSTKIRQVLIILLDNSIKYNKENGEVFLEMLKNNDLVEISITDTGIGIKEEDKNHIFDRFYMADKSRSRGKGGYGLGLSIAKWIVEAHDGEINIESELGKGSTFSIKHQVL